MVFSERIGEQILLHSLPRLNRSQTFRKHRVCRFRADKIVEVRAYPHSALVARLFEENPAEFVSIAVVSDSTVREARVCLLLATLSMVHKLIVPSCCSPRK